jgi:hypothetical protein
MRSNYFKNTIGGIILGISLLLGIGFMSATTAQAQYRNNDYYRQQRQWEREQMRRQRQAQRQQRRQIERYGSYGYGGSGYGISAEGRQTALNAGYNEGIKEGRRDRSRGERLEYRDEGDYGNASVDYNSRYGSRAIYQQYFRQGFANGYRDGYRGY